MLLLISVTTSMLPKTTTGVWIHNAIHLEKRKLVNVGVVKGQPTRSVNLTSVMWPLFRLRLNACTRLVFRLRRKGQHPLSEGGNLIRSEKEKVAGER